MVNGSFKDTRGNMYGVSHRKGCTTGNISDMNISVWFM